MTSLRPLIFLALYLFCSLSRGAVASENNQRYIADFEEVARQYAESKAREYGRKLSWWDIHGKHPHLAERSQYKQYKIDISTDVAKYGVVTKTVDRPGYVYSQWFHNSQSSQPITGQMSKEIQRATTVSWGLKRGLKIGAGVTVSVAMPETFGASFSVSTELSLESSQSTTKSELETFTVSNTILVDPQKSVRAEWTLTEREMVVPWEADVRIGGWIAMWFEEKYNGHWLWFHPITLLANDKFRSVGSELVFHASGVFSGVRGLETTLKTHEYPLMSYYNLGMISRNETIA